VTRIGMPTPSPWTPRVVEFGEEEPSRCPSVCFLALVNRGLETFPAPQRSCTVVAMRIVTWNMGCGSARTGYRKHQHEAWSFLLGELRPDVALVQEAVIKKVLEAEPTHIVSVCDLASKVDAGAAVLVRRDIQAEPIKPPFEVTKSYVATARVWTPAGSFIAATIHIWTGGSYRDALRLVAETAMPALGGEPWGPCG